MCLVASCTQDLSRLRRTDEAKFFVRVFLASTSLFCVLWFSVILLHGPGFFRRASVSRIVKVDAEADENLTVIIDKRTLAEEQHRREKAQEQGPEAEEKAAEMMSFGDSGEGQDCAAPLTSLEFLRTDGSTDEVVPRVAAWKKRFRTTVPALQLHHGEEITQVTKVSWALPEDRVREGFHSKATTLVLKTNFGRVWGPLCGEDPDASESE